ncbi:UDP-N-acetylmuramoyl-L-alanine--D-glutamate ligase [Vibrio europaeus]|uniref:UDP-N-acetylmuramoylalanine--D-glutamate ligase n=1 Tax=Vibrio europaeus TaxID=300876 RepID=A0A178JHY0_9VIBR|nr:UDP-N-acetylmuramoyl-L-alanine--D-glutamate ligase [Vibrio europaeus]MDC5704426.1 UDP-N-acetylmuramoyl-L-alanine--D-glutamate ligase [Vibrio europaeus]MDC5709056.1 UDP-N-acetylmuramoyl-L-alanine--D-glutamate ligase [Vibrio europaeus]MDC5717604.1 UDP-N-acetylmuramoyl-L-alanine--D-glutamate ligase [Vibrio europaeus]MDC5718673.1 UDP-N-acetylmuramoyl-L-alanine--D-glutamate ligase [Vibrio europaeus]MDC5727895.1 UDP-N-acetylmuramoyl-L-alanine--D-glutamate ligase [Vibrio europaeus]
MTIDRWQGIEKVVVVGLGITGLSVVKHLQELPKTLDIRVIDTRDNPPGSDALPEGVELHSGGWNQAWLMAADLVVTNPGIALALPEIEQVINANIPVVGDIELFAWQVNKPVIAITGSNGKSTVTDWTGQVAQAAGFKVGVGGNIGVPALDLLRQDADLYVLELSSFQLETTSSLAPKAAAFLNLSEDHMDRYQGMEDYRQAKLRIFDHASACIVNADDRATYPEQANNLVEFSLNQATRFSLIDKDSKEYLAIDGKPICMSSELSLVGRHNVANALVVLALLTEAGVDVAKGLSALKSYNGLTHRCQVVADNQGVKWVNDSKATNVASTMAALAGLELEGKLYLLVGGVGKGADFSELDPILQSLNVQLCCFGEDGDQFMPLHSSAKRFDTMHEIIKWVATQVSSGDMVLLSPACASFDQFNNFMARGDAFTELAKAYA